MDACDLYVYVWHSPNGRPVYVGWWHLFAIISEEVNEERTLYWINQIVLKMWRWCGAHSNVFVCLQICQFSLRNETPCTQFHTYTNTNKAKQPNLKGKKICLTNVYTYGSFRFYPSLFSLHYSSHSYDFYYYGNYLAFVLYVYVHSVNRAHLNFL